ncbi:MAG: PTS sugar transporter subunit IIA [Planctomycetes bacterium]|nr:PTS sugar transporter subunit IIA [Planctomycetota bacterium]
MTFTDLFRAEAILLDLSEPDKDSVLARLAQSLASLEPELAGREDELRQALQEREARGSTGSQKVGIPHIKLPGITKVTVVLGVHRDGVDFDALDGEDVKVFFSVVRPEDSAEEHLDLLRWIAGIAQHEDFVSFACQASSTDQIQELLGELSVA